MLEPAFPYLDALFLATTVLTVGGLYRAANRSGMVLVIVVSWMVVQGGLALFGFYLPPNYGVPPRILLLAGPPLLVLLALVGTYRGRRFLDALRLDVLTGLHVVRVPVELTLFGLFAVGAVPKVMTFEGRNFDVISGLTAPMVYYLFFVKKRLPRWALMAWNLVCLALLINIVVTAALAAPSPFQQIAFANPNIAILCVPFVWLPSVVVPIVLLAHVVAIRKLTRPDSSVTN